MSLSPCHTGSWQRLTRPGACVCDGTGVPWAQPRKGWALPPEQPRLQSKDRPGDRWWRERGQVSPSKLSHEQRGLRSRTSRAGPGERLGCAVGGGQCGLLDLMGAVAFGAVPSAGGVQCRPLCGLRWAGDLGGPGHAGFHYTGELSLCNKLSPPWKLRTTPVIISVSTVKNLGTAELGTVFRVSQGGGQAEIFRNPGRPSGSRGCFLPS